MRPAGLADFEQEIRARMPERHLLDILKYFGYGCNLGPGQTARHAPAVASAQALRRINAQHINADKLEAAMVDVIDQYARFPLPQHWGSGHTAVADGR